MQTARGPLAEELLWLFITLVTELPLPPLEPEERLKRLLRREVRHMPSSPAHTSSVYTNLNLIKRPCVPNGQVVHRLASGPCPHSEIYDCCHQLAEAADNQAEQLLEDVLKEVRAWTILLFQTLFLAWRVSFRPIWTSQTLGRGPISTHCVCICRMVM